MVEPIREDSARVQFEDEYAGRPDYEGMVSVMEGWVYLHEEGQYIPRRYVFQVSKQDKEIN